MEGIVKRIVLDRGFGFIKAGDGVEYFFHRSTVVDGSFSGLREGQKVSFEISSSPKGPRAEEVRVL